MAYIIKYRGVFFAVFMALSVMPGFAQLTSLRVNHLSNPTGVTTPNPTFSWIVPSRVRNNMQAAYELTVSANGRNVWTSGKVNSDMSTNVTYKGEALRPSTRYTWRVRVWDKQGATKWAQAQFITGLDGASGWRAQWIEPADTNVRKGAPSPMMRKTFMITKPVALALVYVTSHGMHEAYINGAKVGRAHFAPGWTTYHKRLQYYSYDITDMLHRGKNAVGLMLGKGWFQSSLAWTHHFVYQDISKNVGALAQIVVKYKDGTQDIIGTDDTWRSSTGDIIDATIYDGETIDKRKSATGWTQPSFDDSSWQPVVTAAYDNSILVAAESEPVVTRQTVSPVKLITTPSGEKVIDFGQNLVGHEICTLKGRAGQKVTIKHAEVLDQKGNFYTINLRSAKATSTYILSGGTDTFEPTFTFYGFRYLKVDGLDSVNINDFKAAVCYSNFDDNGFFECSNDTINRLQQNIRWGMHGNYLDVPTDCPQRDERLGWMGDAHVFFRTATFNGRVENFFRKWLKDVAADQTKDGRPTDVVPQVLDDNNAGHTGWADAAIIIPWQHYMAYGDKQILVNQYPSMKAWVDYMIRESKNYLWTTGWQYGDWLFFSVDNDLNGTSAVTSKCFIQQAFFLNSLDIVAKSAELLGKQADAEKYRDYYDHALSAFRDAYTTKAGLMVSDTQTAYVLALNFGLLPDDMRPKAARRLAELVNEYGHITTGFLGTPYICDVLTQNGYPEVAYKLLMHKEYPGWLYPITMGATTMWERWNSMMPDHTIPNNGMNSFNHYAYGAIGDWLYRDAVGLQETSPGFKTIRVKPYVGGPFTYMKASEGTPYGQLEAGWTRGGGSLIINVSIPANTRAEVCVPTTDTSSVMMDGKAVKGCIDGNYVVFSVGSGSYTFKSAYNDK